MTYPADDLIKSNLDTETSRKKNISISCFEVLVNCKSINGYFSISSLSAQPLCMSALSDEVIIQYETFHSI